VHFQHELRQAGKRMDEKRRAVSEALSKEEEYSPAKLIPVRFE